MNRENKTVFLGDIVNRVVNNALNTAKNDFKGSLLSETDYFKLPYTNKRKIKN